MRDAEAWKRSAAGQLNDKPHPPNVQRRKNRVSVRPTSPAAHALGSSSRARQHRRTNTRARLRLRMSVGETPQPAATGANSMAGMGHCREATPSNSSSLAALHSGLEQAHEAHARCRHSRSYLFTDKDFTDKDIAKKI